MYLNKTAQIWIETVLYTLMGLALIGLVLGYALPKITNAQEQALIQQSISALKVLDQTITSVVELGPDNIRSYDLAFKRGELYINGTEDRIRFKITGLQENYSEPGYPVTDGRVEILSFTDTTGPGVALSISYKDYANITSMGKDTVQKLSQTPTPYHFFVSNQGANGNLPVIDIRIGS